MNALDLAEGGSPRSWALEGRSTLHKAERGIPVKRCVERAFVGLAIMAAVIGGVAAWEAWGGGKMYWTDLGIDKIQRANLDGTGVEDLITRGLSAPWGIALDGTGGRMYWTDAGSSKIQRANLDGTNVEDLIITYSSGPMSGGGQRYGIALETAR